jgi:hypothetical protein
MRQRKAIEFKIDVGPSFIVSLLASTAKSILYFYRVVKENNPVDE